MPVECPNGVNVLGRTKRCAQKSDAVQLLQPLSVLHIGLSAGHVFDRAGIDEKDFDAGIL